jgi:DNA-binding transcriptional ArsR family regulator
MSTTIIRATHRDRAFTIDQRTIEDESLSWAALGLLSYLLSRPAGWTLRVEELCECGDLGRDAIYNLLNELRKAGYVTYEQERDEYGRIRRGTYTIYETPDLPDPDVPDMARRNPGDPDPAGGAVEFVGWIPEHVRDRALDAVSHLSPEDAQIVIDEWAGRVGCDIVNVPPLEELHTLVEEYMEGRCGLAIAETTRYIRAQPAPERGYIIPDYDWETGSD